MAVIPLFADSMYPVWDLDATQSASYSGSGTTWSNLVANPADGSLQTDYDFSLVNSPTFNGSAGTSGAYWSLDGTNYFQIAGGNTSFINGLHQAYTDGVHNYTSQTWTIVIAMTTSGSDTGVANEDLWGTASGTAFTGTGVSCSVITGGTAEIGLVQTVSNVEGTAVLNNYTPPSDYLIFLSIGNNANIIGYNGGSGNLAAPYIAINRRTWQGTAALLATTSAAPSGTFSIGTAGGGTPMVNGTIIYGCYGFATLLSDSQISSFVDTLNARQGNRWAF